MKFQRTVLNQLTVTYMFSVFDVCFLLLSLLSMRLVFC